MHTQKLQEFRERELARKQAQDYIAATRHTEIFLEYVKIAKRQHKCRQSTIWEGAVQIAQI